MTVTPFSAIIYEVEVADLLHRPYTKAMERNMYKANIEAFCKQVPMNIKMSDDYQRMLELVANHKSHRADNLIKALKGLMNGNHALMSLVSREDFDEFIKLFNKFRIPGVDVRRRGRGPRDAERTYIPKDLKVNDANVKFFSVYVEMRT